MTECFSQREAAIRSALHRSTGSSTDDVRTEGGWGIPEAGHTMREMSHECLSVGHW